MAMKTHLIIFFSYYKKLDFQGEMPVEKDVLWIYFFEKEWHIFNLPILDTLQSDY